MDYTDSLYKAHPNLSWCNKGVAKYFELLTGNSNLNSLTANQMVDFWSNNLSLWEPIEIKDALVFLKMQYDDSDDYHFLRIEWDNNKSEYLTEEYGAWVKDEYFTQIGKTNSDLLAVVEINDNLL